uniref:F-box only protein 47-like n=1 Tax=Solea senegalensis TaxID=28829 RepID=UPI001CD8EAA0|nr:F-box only protein 47-like [Solea senegalensis]XP_043890090.1 F-box only protein 47-like [Solea senegalensis]
MDMMRKDSRKVKRTLYPTKTIMTRSQCLTSSGYFHRLPAEVFHMILDKVSVLELSVFSMVSKEISRCVMDYISTLAWRKKMITQNHSSCLEQGSTNGPFRNLGLLFKRCTLFLPAKEKLKFIFSQLSKIPCFMLEQCLVPNCSGFARCGVFLQTLTAQWDELECHRVFNFLWEHTNLLQKIETVIYAKPGTRWYQELQLRSFCRQVLLDPRQNQPSECQFWLMQLLKPWPIVSQARLLFILYGPLMPEGTLVWQDLVERGLSHGALWDLATSFLLLIGKREVKGWTSNSMLAILEELIVIPQPWHVENVARLLVLCGNTLCYAVLANKALNGRLAEISRLIVFIILVSEKDSYNMSNVVKLVIRICKIFSTSAEKTGFIQQLENMFSEITREFFEVCVAGNHLENREAFQSLCILLDSSARFHTKLILQVPM